MTTKPPAPPYVGPAAHTSAGSNQPIHRVVIHCTVSPCVEGGARKTAAYFRTQASGGSAHYVVDPGEVVQVVYDNVIAWHAPPNQNSLGIELTDPMVDKDGHELPAARWSDDNHKAMLRLAATLTAQLCAAYGVPVVRLSSADLLAGKHGICGHADVSQAWHQSDHWDPGHTFPWASFMALVRREYDKITAPQPAPAPAETVWFYNLATPTERHMTVAAANHQVADEIEAILATRPRLLGLVEAVGYDLPTVKGFTLLHDRSNQSRANVALYVSDADPVRRHSWTDSRQTWHRTQHAGIHPARSFLSATMESGLQAGVVHQPPRNTDNVQASQAEGLQVVTRVMAAWKRKSRALTRPFAKRRSRVLIGDFNAVEGEHGVTPASFAAALSGQVVDAHHIDTGVVRNLLVSHVAYVTHVGGVQLLSDHKHALRFTIRRP